MDSYHEKKAIEKQNDKWANKKKPKKNIDKRAHPWYKTDGFIKYKMNKIWNQDITPENKIIENS